MYSMMAVMNAPNNDDDGRTENFPGKGIQRDNKQSRCTPHLPPCVDFRTVVMFLHRVSGSFGGQAADPLHADVAGLVLGILCICLEGIMLLLRGREWEDTQ